MNTSTLKHVPINDQQEWKTEEYHGKQMHVCAKPRAHENEALSGPGHQWDFTVKITEDGIGPMPDGIASAKSDLECFYTTQAIAENMGFLKGRELIEGESAPAK